MYHPEVRATVSIVKTGLALISSNDEVRSQFAQFRKKIDGHHEGHANNARSMARKMNRAVAALPPASTCDELKRAVADLGGRLSEETVAANRDQNIRTEYGRTSGATWPS